MNDMFHLSEIDVFIAVGLVAIAIGISLWLGLKLEKNLIVASIRTVIQLSLIGLTLTWVFEHQSPSLLLIIVSAMTFIAAWAARKRVQKAYKGLLRDTCLAVAISGWSIAIIALLFIFRLEPWNSARVAIPVLGLILGNTLTGISLCMDHFVSSLHRDAARIRMYLALSATPWEAVKEQAQAAARIGMMPTINSMTVVGVVSLPGMMTGQIMAGIDPVDAVKYQIVTMFLICAACGVGCFIALKLVMRRFFNEHDQLVFPEPR